MMSRCAATAGQRSIRLNRQWRAIYTLESDAARIEFVRVDEVTPHKY
jgi:proteic killer suppression protein